MRVLFPFPATELFRSLYAGLLRIEVIPYIKHATLRLLHISDAPTFTL
jgi:hypothetical protein